MTPADLKAAGQMASLFAVSDTTRQDFERILTLAPIEFSSNDIRERLNWADIPESARGGLFRMLEPSECKGAMAFPGTYVILGNRREQVRMVGNAVTPPAARDLIAAVAAAITGETP